MNALSRRQFLGLSTGAAAALLSISVDSRSLSWAKTNPWPTTKDKELLDQISSGAESYVSTYNLPGLSVGILAKDEVVFARAYGYKNANLGQPYTPESVQCMESVSKSITATAVMQLVESGRLNIELPLTDYLPEFSLTDPRYRQITIRHLLAHSSGLPFALPSEEALGPFGEFMNPLYGPDAAWQLLSQMANENITLLNQPGDPTVFNYSDIGYDILAAVINRISGEVFDDYCQKHIMRPLGMTSSTFLLSEVRPELLVQAHVLDTTGNPVVSPVYPYARQHGPSSCLHSNVADMSRWLVTHLNHGKLGQVRILKTPSQKELWTHLSPNLGGDWYYNWGCLSFPVDGHAAIGYFGGVLTQTALVMVPDRNLAVVALSNLDAPWVVGDFATWALSQMLAEKCCHPVTPVSQWRIGPLPKRIIGR